MAGTGDEIGKPLIGAPLPNADRASIDPEKLTTYALDPENVVGRHKARVFEAALGITKDNWKYLHDELLRGLPNHSVSAVRPPRRDDERFTWEVLVPITGLNGRRLLVVTAWEMVSERPRLVTTRVAPKAKQPPDERH